MRCTGDPLLRCGLFCRSSRREREVGCFFCNPPYISLLTHCGSNDHKLCGGVTTSPGLPGDGVTYRFTVGNEGTRLSPRRTGTHPAAASGAAAGDGSASAYGSASGSCGACGDDGCACGPWLYLERRIFGRLKGETGGRGAAGVSTMTAPLKILLLDTETNGLPKNRFAPISMTEAYPAIVQLSWAIYTVAGRTLTPGPKKDYRVALHPSVPWDADAAKVHGLTEESARRGTPAAAVFQELAAVLRSVDVVVAHNLSFDKPVIRAAAYAEWAAGRGPIELRELWPRAYDSKPDGRNGIKELCTMRATLELCKIPSPTKPGEFKLPRLNELYTHLYGHVYDMSGAVLHTASSDTHCLAQCIGGLLKKGLARVEGGTLVISPSSPAVISA